MKYFNLDLHVSVASDVATNLDYLGHTVDENCMSGHWWALNKPRAHRGTTLDKRDGRIGYGPINLATWEGIFWRPVLPDDTMDVSQEMADKCPELASYDGFICCYPPSFAYLYAKFNKPIIMDVPIRYEWPFTANADHWHRWNRYLAAGQDSGQIRLVGNSVYECKYYEWFTGRKMTYISSTCEYIDRFSPKWRPGSQEIVYSMGEHAGCREAAQNVPGVQFIRDAKPQYLHSDIAAAKAVVWIPYNCSIMSFFEHYWLNIPIFVPSARFLLELYARKCAMSQVSWNYEHTGSLLPCASESINLPDPNHKDGLIHWLDFYDFYNVSEHPHITYFDSWAELKTLLDSVDLQQVSTGMAQQNIRRKERNISAWNTITKP